MPATSASYIGVFVGGFALALFIGRAVWQRPVTETPTPVIATPIIAPVATHAQDATPTADEARQISQDAAVLSTNSAVGSAASKAEFIATNQMNELRNAIANASSLAGLVDCVRAEGDGIAGRIVIELAIAVDSTPSKAIVGPWRFSSIIEGQQLPTDFATCASKAMKVAPEVTPPVGRAFPSFHGDLTERYRIPEP
jgi:hypothetical protein